MELKRKWLAGEPHEYLKGRAIGMLFEKPSTRTRVSFMSAIIHLGAHPRPLAPGEMQLSRGEPIKDTARVLDRYLDALVIRTFGQEIVEEYARYMRIPVINALIDLTHPCQGLADLMTIWEKKGRRRRLKIAYVGDIWNVSHTLMVASTLFRYSLHIARPKGYEPDPRIMEYVQERGGDVNFTEDLEEALRDADIVYANTWHSMELLRRRRRGGSGTPARSGEGGKQPGLRPGRAPQPPN